MISTSKTTFCHFNFKILRLKVTKNIKNLRKKFCESAPRSLSQRNLTQKKFPFFWSNFFCWWQLWEHFCSFLLLFLFQEKRFDLRLDFQVWPKKIPTILICCCCCCCCRSLCCWCEHFFWEILFFESIFFCQ